MPSSAYFLEDPISLEADVLLTFVRHLNDERLSCRSVELIRAVDSRLRLSLLDTQFTRRAELAGLTEDFTVIFHLQLVIYELVLATAQVLDFDSVGKIFFSLVWNTVKKAHCYLQKKHTYLSLGTMGCPLKDHTASAVWS